MRVWLRVVTERVTSCANAVLHVYRLQLPAKLTITANFPHAGVEATAAERVFYLGVAG